MIPAELREQRDFLRLWWARVAGVTGAQMLLLAIGWQLFQLTGSAWDLGLLGLAQFLPAVSLVLVAGPVVDRFDRARLVALCVGLQGVVAAALAVCVLLGVVQRPLLLGLAVILGAVRAFQMPAQQALLPMLLPAPLLPRGLAFGSAGLQAAIIGGPALGGLVYGIDPLAVYALASVLFGVGGGLCLRLPPARPRVLAGRERTAVLAGLSYVWRHPVLLGAMALDLFAVLLGGATALLPLYAHDILHVDAAGLGLLRSAPAVGALTMSVALSRWPLCQRAGPRLLKAVAAYGMAMLVFGLSTHFVLSLLALVAAGAADMISVVVRQTLVQLETPDAMRGRVSAVNSLFIGASNQLGEFESGALAAAIGPVGSVVCGGIGAVALALLWPRWFPALAQRDALAPSLAGPADERQPSAGEAPR